MATDKQPGPVRAAVGKVRARVAGVQRIIALGFGVVILASLLHWGLALNVFMPLAKTLGVSLGPGVTAQVLRAFTEQIGLLIVLPGLSWLVGWVFDDRPLRLTLGAGLFAEAWMLAVAYLSGGWDAILGVPAYVIARLLFMAGIALLAARAYEHSRAKAEAGGNRRREPEKPISIPVPPPSADPSDDEAVVPDDEVVEEPAPTEPAPADAEASDDPDA